MTFSLPSRSGRANSRALPIDTTRTDKIRTLRRYTPLHNNYPPLPLLLLPQSHQMAPHPLIGRYLIKIRQRIAHVVRQDRLGLVGRQGRYG